MLKAADFLPPADQFALLLDDAGISYHREYMFDPKPSAGEKRKQRKWRFDFIFQGKIAVEIDGGVWARKGAKKCQVCGQVPAGRHVGGRGFISDCEKTNRAQELGWRVFRVPAQWVGTGQALELVRRVV
jgi:hypothetical protein